MLNLETFCDTAQQGLDFEVSRACFVAHKLHFAVSGASFVVPKLH